MGNLNLNDIRDKISSIDKELVVLLEQRFDLVIQVGAFKIENNLPIFDEKREKAVIEKSTELLRNKNYSKYLEKLYGEIMNTCKDIQKNEIKIL